MKLFVLVLFISFYSCFVMSSDANQLISFISGPSVVDEGESLKVQIKFSAPISKKEVKAIWLDTKGRICEQKIVSTIDHASSISFVFDLKAPIGYEHFIQVYIDGVLQIINHKFILRYPYKKWLDYKSSVWAHYDPAYASLFREGGLNSSIGGDPNVTSQDIAFYNQNIVYEVFSYYHKRRNEHEAMKELWEVKPDNVVLHHRRPSLTDEGSFDKVKERLWPVIEKTKDYRPIFYNIADEIGIADQSAVSDLDWEYSNRTAWMQWLQRKYKTIEAINQQWGTNYTSWQSVRAYFPSTHKIYDQIHIQNLLPKEFGTIEKLQEKFNSKIDSYENLINAFAKIRNHDAGMTAIGLEQRFKKIENFNKHFETDAKSFSDAEKFVMVYENWVANQDASDTTEWNLSWWCDWREYMDEYMAVGLGRARDLGKEKDPDGVFGVTGTHHPGVFNGHNYEKLMNHLDFIMPYNIGESFELLRGLKSDFLYMHPTWQTGNKLKHEVWYQFLHGCRGILLWDNFEKKHTMIDRDAFTLTERGQSAASDFKEINDGLDQLFFQSKRENNGIAIFHSQTSARINWLHQFIGLGRHWIKRFSWQEYNQDARNTLRTAWIKLIEDNGLQFVFITPYQLEGNRIETEGIRTIILPEVWALSDKDAELLKIFVSNGGVVIADHFTGLYDGNGKRRLGGALDDAFGIDQSNVLGDTRYSKKEFQASDISFTKNFNQFVKKGVFLKDLNTRVNGHQSVSIKGEGVKFHCGAENDAAVIEKKYGKGRFVFLNIDVSSYGWLRIENKQKSQTLSEQLVSIVGQYLNENSVPIAKVFQKASGLRQQGVETGLWHVSDNMKILGSWRNYQISKTGIGGEDFVDNSLFEKEEEIKIVLEEKYFVRNLRTGEELGELDKIEATLKPWEPVLFGLSKIKDIRFSLVLPENIFLGEELIVKINNDLKGELRSFFVEMVDPKGEIYWYYRKDVSGKASILECSIPLALNDIAGVWKVRVRDVFTKQIIEKEIDVKAK